MPRFTGQLTINLGVARLSGTRLAMEPLTDGPFGNAASFLRQDRNLKSGDRIWVDGTPDQIGNVQVIVITDAGLELPAIVGAGGTLLAMNAAKKGRSSAGRGAPSPTRKAGTKKGAAKKSSSKKSRLKKSARKQS